MSKHVQHIYSFDVDKVLFMLKIYYYDTKRNESLNRKVYFEHIIRLLDGEISYFSKHYEACLLLYKCDNQKYKYIDLPISVCNDLVSLHPLICNNI